MSLITEGEAKVTKAKTNLILKHPFIAIIALALRYRNAREFGITLPYPTMATDGRYIFWDEVFVASITVYELIGTIAHEVFHVILMHMFRRGDRDPLLWNMAGDYIVNIIVLDMGFQLPKDHLYDAKYRDEGWTVERVYDDLKKQEEELKSKINPVPTNQPGQGSPQKGDSDQTQPSQGQGEETPQGGSQPAQNGKPGQGKQNLWGTFMDPIREDGTPMDAAEKTEMVEEIKVRITQAAAAAKNVGNLPGVLQGLIKAVGKPVVNWHDYIQSWVRGHTPDNYTWRKPNRRMLGLYDMIAPTVEMNGAGVGVLSIDESGSVENHELRKYATEIVGMIEICKPDKLYIILHDSIVQHVYLWERGDDFDSLKVKGRGGTKIRPVFKHVREQIDEQIDWMVCFTDMEINDFPPESEAPDFPVLWAATGPDKGSKFGVYLPLKDEIEMVS